jgi:RNA polymerase sigma-70 factor, ECF subfamily
MRLILPANLDADARNLMESNDLVARARQGDHEAFRLIFEREHRFVMRFLYAMVGERSLAEELTQETFVRAYRRLNTIRTEVKISTWLCGIARNVALNWLRSHRKQDQSLAEESMVQECVDDLASQPDRYLLNSELRQVIHNALVSLDHDKRLVFTLKVMQQLSYEDIAAITGHSIPKLKTDLHRAKAAIRRMLLPYLEKSDEL